MRPNRSAFTMLEVIFVIVILSIVALMSTDVLKNVYLDYRFQQTGSDLHFRSKLAVKQIAKHLDRSIFDSVVFDPAETLVFFTDQDTALTGGTSAKTIKWIGKDIESFQGMWDDDNGTIIPGYSAFANLDLSSGANVVTCLSNDCNGTYANTIQTAITGEASWANRSALYFMRGYGHLSAQEAFWNGTDSQALFPIQDFSGSTITLSRAPYDPPNNRILPMSEHYLLAYSGYALQFSGGNLTLYYNFQPWLGETFTQGSSSLLAENVTSFAIWGENANGIIRFRLCLDDSDDDFMEYCKESLVMR